MSLDRTYTVAQVAEALQVSRWWVEKQVKLGRVSPARIGDHKRAAMRFYPEDLEQLKLSLRPAPAPERKRRRSRRAA